MGRLIDKAAYVFSRHIKSSDGGFVGYSYRVLLYTPCFFPIRQCRLCFKLAVCLYYVQRVFVDCHANTRSLNGEQTADRGNENEK